ncbi:hypothetical protein Scep_004269 [Stephania cephalantha]|uniref:Uncharacterized protein n=1 Tax=Stephania cephalantha TaxID=152367 RepID=A0AAP0PNU9_9MAGN
MSQLCHTLVLNTQSQLTYPPFTLHLTPPSFSPLPHVTLSLSPLLHVTHSHTPHTHTRQ